MAKEKTKKTKGFGYRFKHNKAAMIGLVILVIELLIFFIGPSVYPIDPNQAGAGGFNAAPDAAHILGTDTLGRDCLSRLLYGGRTSLFIGISAMAISVPRMVPNKTVKKERISVFSTPSMKKPLYFVIIFPMVSRNCMTLLLPHQVCFFQGRQNR